MNKRFISTTLSVVIGFSALGIVPDTIHPIKVSAATTNTQNNQQAVEAKADQLIQTAKSLIGKATYSNTEYKPTFPYIFSCATFLMYIFEQNDVDLATYNEDFMMQQGTPVAKNQLQKGDLLFFDSKGGNIPNHVGMYIGDNKIIQMADPKQKIVITDLDSKPYYEESYITARRVLPTIMSSNPATKGDKIVEKAYSLKDKAKMGSVNNESSLRFTATGFIDYVYKTNDVKLGTTNLQDLMNKGTTVSKANLKKGDLVFFNSTKGSKTPSMVAIYAGDHRIIIPNSNGVLTRVLLVDYYEQHYITAKRVFTGSASASPSPSVEVPKTSASPSVEPPKTSASPSVETPKTSALPADKIINLASSLIGKAKFGYGYDEKSLTFTSAGFTYYVFNQHGIDLKSKVASQQAKVGNAVQKNNLQKGDLIFFSNGGTKITESAIYIGANQYIRLKTDGSTVKESLNSTWANKNYKMARRVL
ncbi:C40 family peptidase [Psychrobacillus sp. OK032]|uniref:C40 family peptidase n=1 Tax=Psychrobacillus sp. OK032 TaxID=1884358 RepID=UPI0008AF78DE|nr:NlpC/P60 family protein [Psychrobacillus sp. OK032]SER97910.1 Cell wall-associated hydrolase, NlpC family [Psychrobacillus sp. OK032]